MLLQSSFVIVPPQSSVLSAFGTLVTPIRLDLVRSSLSRLAAIDWDRAGQVLDELTDEAYAALEEAGCPRGNVTLIFGADLRYLGQQHEVSVTLDADPRIQRDSAAIAKTFEEAYRVLYGVNPSHVPVELVTWRLTARGPVTPFDRVLAPSGAPGKPKCARTVNAWSDGASVPVYDRKDLAVGQTISGPAIIEERETTTALPPDWTATIDRFGCIIARKGS
jgi:N-methylhydantoinase A